MLTVILQEIKCDFCPFCGGWPLNTGEFLLIGESPQLRQDSISGAYSVASTSDGYGSESTKYGRPPYALPLSRRPSLITSVSAARRDSRKGSVPRKDSVASTASYDSAPMYDTGPVYTTGERNQQINARIDRYLNDHPDHLDRARFPSSGSVSSTSSKWGSLSLSREGTMTEDPIQEEQEEQDDEEDEEVAKQEKAWIRKSKDLSSFAKAARRKSRDLGSFFR